MFWKRLASGVVILAVVATALIFGGNVLFFLLEIISLVGLFELYRLGKVSRNILGLAGYLSTFAYYMLLNAGKNDWIMPELIIFFIVVMGVYVFTFPKFKTNQVTLVFFGFFYVAVLLSYVYQIRMLDEGKWLVWLIFISSWGADTLAYCVGMLFGKRKMAPKLSPKKSVEGAFGGLIGAGILGLIYSVIVNKVAGTTWNVFAMFFICVVAAAISMIGDLAASAIKRNYDVKDYSKLIPGHGGILDRFDSVIMIAPVIYFMVVAFAKNF
jgi:phosphatidate cytidylyltransferase